MAPSQAHSPAPAADKRTQALLLAHEKLAKYCFQLYSPREILYRAEAIYKQAYDANLKRKDSLRAFLAACIFLAYRQERLFIDINFMLGRIDTSVTKTIEALWYLEILVDGVEIRQDKITVTSETSNSRFSIYIRGQPSVGMFISESFLPLLCGFLSSGACCSSRSRAYAPKTCRSLVKTPELSNADSENSIDVHLALPGGPKVVVPWGLTTVSPKLREILARGTALSEKTQEEAELSKELATMQDNSSEAVEQHEVVAMENDNDWDVINWEDEQKTIIDTAHKPEKNAKAKEWTGALRRGIFG